MTPAQQTALEGLVGRALTEQEIDAIDVLLPERNDVAIAAVLSVGRTKAKAREIGNGTVLEVLGLDSGNALLDALAANASFRHVRPLLEQGRLQVGAALVATSLQQLVVAGVLDQTGCDALIALGRDPDPIHYNAVSDALNIAEGRLTL